MLFGELEDDYAGRDVRIQRADVPHLRNLDADIQQRQHVRRNALLLGAHHQHALGREADAGKALGVGGLLYADDAAAAGTHFAEVAGQVLDLDLGDRQMALRTDAAEDRLRLRNVAAR